VSVSIDVPDWKYLPIKVFEESCCFSIAISVILNQLVRDPQQGGASDPLSRMDQTVLPENWFGDISWKPDLELQYNVASYFGSPLNQGWIPCSFLWTA